MIRSSVRVRLSAPPQRGLQFALRSICMGRRVYYYVGCGGHGAMTDIIVQKKGLLRSSGGPFWYYSSICLPKNMAAALASMDCLSVQSSVSSVAMNATAPVISPFVRIGAMVRAWVVIPSTALSGSAVVSV